MKKFDYYLLIAVSAIFAAALSSCVNEEYDVKDINTEVTLGSEGIALPLGSTKQLTLKNLLSSMDEDMLQVLEGGAYAFRLSDTLNLGDQLPDLSEMLVIPDVVFEEKTTFNLSDIDVESMSIEGQEFAYEFEVADAGLDTDVEIPAMSINENDPTGIWEYGKAAREMTIDVDDIHLATQPIFRFSGIPGGGSGEISLPDFPKTAIEADVVPFVVKSEAPEGISEISDIMMSDKSVIEVSISLSDSFLKEGNIIPDFTVDFDDLVVFGDGESVVNVGEDFVLNAQNGYSASKEYHISKINISQSDWDEQGMLEIKKNLSISGHASLTGAVIDVSSLAGAGLGLKLDVKFKEIGIKSVEMDIDVDPVTEQTVIPIEIKDIELPDGITSIDNVEFTENSGLDLYIKMNNLDIEGLEIRLQSLKIEFPENIQVKGATDGVVLLEDVSIIEGLDHKIHISSIQLPAPVNGTISYKDEVKLEAVMTLGGRICSADVPYTEDKDGVFIIDAESHFEIDDYSLQIETISHDVEIEPQVFSYELPDDISDIGQFSIIPEGNPVIKVNLDLPEIGLPVKAADEGLVLSFPEFLRFKDVAGDFDEQTNTLVLTGEIPEQILLPLEKLSVNPQADPQTGKYSVAGEINVAGSLEIPAGEVTGKDIDELLASKISVSALIPSLKASEILFDKFEMGMEEQFEFTVLKAEDIPAELKSVSEIVLDDVKVNLAVDINNMPDLNATPVLDFVLVLPEILVLDETDSRVDGNTVRIKGNIEKNKFAIDPIAVKALDLSKHDFTSGKDLVATLSVDGSISAENPQIDLSKLKSDVDLKIKAAIEDIAIEKVSAKVDYKIDGINEQFKIEGLPEFMKGEGFVIDLANPHLIITVNTNMGIPVSGNVSIIPYVDGKETDARIDASIAIPYSESADKTVSRVFWFGSKKEACPADYVFVQADINKLIRQIPDQLKLQLVAETDADKSCVVEPTAEYALDVNYDLVIPLEFGDKLNIEISDTLTGLPDIIGQLLEKNPVQLGGSITSSLPLALELKMDMLDMNGQVIPVEKEISQMISACGSNGEAVESPLDLTLDVKDGVSSAGFSALKLTFKVTSPNATGIPVDEADYVQANLKLMLPEGATVDIADMLNSDEN